MNGVFIGTVIAAIATVICAMIAARAARQTAADQREAQRLAAAPAQRQVDLSILTSTTERLDQENEDIRIELRGMRALVRAFAWTLDRWARQMIDNGIEPAEPHELVKEYNRTGT